jgi:hypothetical protein
MNPYRLFLEFLFGLVGAAYLVYGKKQGNMLVLACGLGLGLFPYFVDSFVAIGIIGFLLIVVPFILRAR